MSIFRVLSDYIDERIAVAPIIGGAAKDIAKWMEIDKFYNPPKLGDPPEIYMPLIRSYILDLRNEVKRLTLLINDGEEGGDYEP